MSCDIYPQIRGPEGWTDSQLFKDLLSNGFSRSAAKTVYQSVYSDAYRDMYGDWLNEPDNFVGELDRNGEPTINSVFPASFLQGRPHVGSTTMSSRLSRKLSALASSLDVNIVIDNAQDTLARVVGGEERATIYLNSEKLQDDTIEHEFGHIFIEVIGGLDNPLVQRGIEQLRGTELWNEVESTYSGVNRDTLHKEVLATAIGREASQIFQRENDQSAWERWLNLFLRRLRQVLGIEPDIARDLARRMITSTREYDTSGTYTYEQRDYKDLQGLRDTAEEAVSTIERVITEIGRGFKGDDRESVERTIKENRKRLNSLKSKLAESKNDEVLAKFLEYVIPEIDRVFQEFNEEVKKDDPSLGKITRHLKFTKAYELITHIDILADDNQELADFLGDTRDQIAKASTKITKIQNRYEDEALEILVDIFTPLSRNEVLQRKREKWKQQWRRMDNPDQTLPQYIAKKKEQQKAEIEEAARRKARSSLTLLEEDVGSWMRYLRAAGHSRDSMIAMFKQMLDKTRDKARGKYVDWEKEWIDAYNDLIEYKREDQNVDTDDVSEVYDEILDRDGSGNLTGYLINKYSAEYIQNRAEALEEYREILEEEDKEAADEHIKEWFKENTVKDKNGNRVPDSRYINDKYKRIQNMDESHPVKKFYNLTIESLKKQDGGRPPNKRLVSKVSGVEFYRLPALRKGKWERIGSDGMSFNTLNQIRKEEFSIMPDDTEYSQQEIEKILVKEGIEGRPKKFVPIYFTSDAIDLDNHSFDIATIMAANAHMSYRYQEVTNMLPIVDAMEHALSQKRRVQQKTPGGQLLFTGRREDNKRATEPWSESESYKLWRAVVDTYVFDETRVAGKYDKFWQKVLGGVSTVFLSGNVIAGTINLTKGNIDTLMESIGGEFFTLSDWKNAQKEYMRDVANGSIINDIGINDRTSRTNLLSEEFDALNEFRGSEFNFAENSVFKRLAKVSTLFGIHTAGEHYMQNVTMYAVMSNIKAANAEGEFINENGEVVSESEAMSLHEAYQVEDGELVLNDNLSHVVMEDQIFEYNEDTKFRITRRIRDVNEEMHGAYSLQNRNDAQRYILGMYAFSMRKWIEPGIRRRMGKGGYKDLFSALWTGEGTIDKDFDYQRNTAVEGYYVTFAKFLNRFFTELHGMITELPGMWNEMSDIEKANIKKFATEATFFFAAFALYGMAQSMRDDDEDSILINHIAYATRRLMAELSFFLNPGDAKNILDSPIPATSYLNDLFDFGYRVIFSLNPIGYLFWEDWTPPIAERYERTRRKGQLKIRKDIQDIAPWWRHIDNVRHPEELISFFNM